MVACGVAVLVGAPQQLGLRLRPGRAERLSPEANGYITQPINVDIVTDVISRSITPSAGLEEPP